jgi:hypothetical protein
MALERDRAYQHDYLDLPEFSVRLSGPSSVVTMDGALLRGVRDVKVHQPLEGPAVVTIEFLSRGVKGIVD